VLASLAVLCGGFMNGSKASYLCNKASFPDECSTLSVQFCSIHPL
jgi:hypothetical protein